MAIADDASPVLYKAEIVSSAAVIIFEKRLSDDQIRWPELYRIERESATMPGDI